MLRSYFRTAFRFLWRQKAYSTLNILGLAVGLACSFFILLWVQDELSYDQFHAEGDRIYRVMRNYSPQEGKTFTWSAVPMPMADVLRNEYPEVEHAVLTIGGEALVANGTDTFRESGRFAGPEFFQMFSFPLVAGQSQTALSDPNSIAISERLARKAFGADWEGRALGQTLRVDDRKDFIVSAVFADVPDNSTLQFEYVLPVDDFIRRNEWTQEWGNSGLRLYVQLRPGSHLAAVNDKIANLLDGHDHENTALFLQAYTRVHLHSNFEGGEEAGGRIDYVGMFVVVALLVLLIASINFMNLATARSSQRAREIGVRKAIGATRRALSGQFIGESIGTALIALIIATAIVTSGLPAFNALANKSITFSEVFSPGVIGLFVVITVVVGVVSGSYPALYLSSFRVASVLRGRTREHGGQAGFRRALVVFQFAMSILLVIGSVTVYRQIDYIQSKNVGLDRENLISLPLEGNARDQRDAFMERVRDQPGIAYVTASNQDPLQLGNSTSSPSWKGKKEDSQVLFYIVNADYDYVETMKMNMAAGRSFSRAYGADSLGYIVNQEAARAMGMDQPVGQELSFWGQTGTIIGVVEDFHMASLYSAIEPTIIRLNPENTSMLFVRTTSGDTEQALASLEALYGQFNPSYPFEYEFVDEQYAEMYRSEQVIGALAQVFTALALFVACLGLLGLASYSAERRTREIGVRKALGASVVSVVLLLSRDFVKLVAFAFVVAAPLAYYVIQEWLGSFEYRIEVGVGLFLIAGIVALVAASLVVGLQSTRAALLDPVKALRQE